MPLVPGDTLGPYEILSPVGKGGMGEVWKAHDTRLHRIVAIKQLRDRHDARFEQEARAIAALNHPHICQIYDVGPGYLVLEFVEGKPLQGPLSPEQAWPLARQIASALEAAHAKGLLHRDLKPANILVTATGAKLLDFGIATWGESADLTHTAGLAGTPLYMSPEQIEGQPLDARSDIFSFGIVLYELLTGRRPFDSVASVLRDDPTPTGHDLVARCLAKQPAQRFGSMTEVLAALRSIDAPPVTTQTSIAVLPFANMSRDAGDEYFSDGLSEDIINLLAQVPNLKVTARTSAFAFRGKEQDITRIAEVLRVKTVLEGSVRRAGNRIRVTAQLINAADGYHILSERYDRELTDVFAIQDEIAAAIVRALQLKLGSAPAPRRTPSLAAYDAYQKTATTSGASLPTHSRAAASAWSRRSRSIPRSRSPMSAWPTTISRRPPPARAAPRRPCRRHEPLPNAPCISNRIWPKRTPCWASWPGSTTSTGTNASGDSPWQWRTSQCRHKCWSGTSTSMRFRSGDWKRHGRACSA